MSEEINYKQQIETGIQLIQEWMKKEQSNLGDSLDYKELKRVIQEIIDEKDYSNESFEDIQYVLRPFEEVIPLKIKRIFNISVMDHYTMFIASRWFDTIDDHINLILSTKRFQLNLTKFHYNPISLTKTTREFFDHLQTLYLYSEEDDQFQNDSRIIERKYCKVERYDLFKNQVDKIEEWTSLKCCDVIFDSNIDDWSMDTSVFDQRIIGKSNLIFIIEDTDNEKFGYFFDKQITDEYNKWIESDSKTFLFNIQSNGRLQQPIKFEIKDISSGGYCLYEDYEEMLIEIGDIALCKANTKINSYCFQYQKYFDYHGIENALCGKQRNAYGYFDFTIKRIVVIQMK